MRRRRVVLFFVAVAVAACGGSTGDSDDAGAIVSADDGVAEIELPVGMDAAGIAIEEAQVPEGFAADDATVFAYDLTPDGLEFDAPATLRLTLPVSPGAVPIGVAGVGDSFDDLTAIPAEFTVIDDELVIEAEIDHFSVVAVAIDVGLSAVTIEHDCPITFTEGQACTIRAPGIADRPEVTVTFTAPDPQKFRIESQEVESAVYRCVGESDFSYVATLQVEVAPDFVDALLNVSEWARVEDFFRPALWSHTGYCDASDASTPSSSTSTTAGAAEPGTDPEGDQYDSSTSSKIEPGEGHPGSDITRVSHRVEEGVHIFTIEVAGDGKALAESEDTGHYDVTVEVQGRVGMDWGANATFRDAGTVQDRGVRVGPYGPDRDRLEDASVTMSWLDSSTLEVTVDPGDGAELDVDSFDVLVISEVDDVGRYDRAVGIGGG